MTFVVPFDGSDLAEAALVRAVEYGAALDVAVTAVTVVPERTRYAREKSWIGRDENYDPGRVVESLRGRVETLAPEASFDFERIREFPPEAEIAEHIGALALEHDPAVVFLGSDNVGRVVTPLASVGVHVAAEDDYDVFIVRRPSPPRIDAVERHDAFYDA
ncbi:universal stress family protein [Halovivax ruber XH-70]|uniref:Universal stress family protein n=1 Tax=Halovivax ruber (strain DSM 18193 / JCM 13892 / XH-70) TaxID=797302 RepID=L0IFC6_HALRX|nr:universal stress protein [Halovivax ruber]AGB17543.1 universal stress family protein [Halovivax ruber XH-70]